MSSAPSQDNSEDSGNYSEAEGGYSKDSDSYLEEAVEAHEWADNVSRPYHLTIRDVLDLPPGGQMEILCLDRNWEDLTIYNDDIPAETVMWPEDFFKDAYQITFTKDLDNKENPLKGSAFYHDIDDKPNENFEFDINYRDENWYPLEGNQLVANTCENPKRKNECWEFCDGCTACCQPGPAKYAHVDVLTAVEQGLFGWTLETRLGWRGPMIQKKDLVNLPPIYHSKEYFENLKDKEKSE